MMSNQERASVFNTQEENQTVYSSLIGQQSKTSKSSEENSNHQQTANSHTITSLHLENQETIQTNLMSESQVKYEKLAKQLVEKLFPIRKIDYNDMERKTLLMKMEGLVGTYNLMLILRIKTVFESYIISELQEDKKLLMEEEGFTLFRAAVENSEIFKKMKDESNSIFVEFINLIFKIPSEFLTKVQHSLYWRLDLSLNLFFYNFHRMIEGIKWFEKKDQIDITKEIDNFLNIVNEEFNKNDFKSQNFDSLAKHIEWLNEISIAFFK